MNGCYFPTAPRFIAGEKGRCPSPHQKLTARVISKPKHLEALHHQFAYETPPHSPLAFLSRHLPSIFHLLAHSLESSMTPRLRKESPGLPVLEVAVLQMSQLNGVSQLCVQGSVESVAWPFMKDS